MEVDRNVRPLTFWFTSGERERFPKLFETAIRYLSQFLVILSMRNEESVGIYLLMHLCTKILLMKL